MQQPGVASTSPDRPFGDTPVGRLFEAKRAHAKSRLADFRELLASTDNPGCRCPDEMLCRFIESSIAVRSHEVKEANLKAAASGIAATIKWRAEFGADKLTSCPTCDVDPFAHCMFSIGLDKRGWELTYSCAGRTTAKDAHTVSRHLVAYLEQTFNRANAPTHLVLLLDLHGFGLGDLDPRVGLRAINILLSHYPDRIAQCVLLDAPFIFSAVLGVLKRGIDELSQQKLVTVTKGAATEEYLNTFLSEKQAAFVREMLKLRARPAFESFTPLTDDLRVSLGPCDAFTKEVRKRRAEAQAEGSAQVGGAETLPPASEEDAPATGPVPADAEALLQA